MSVSEEERHELCLALEEVHGRARATTLMQLLPPVGWADVATKRDLDHLEERIGLRFGAMDHRFGAMEHRFETIDHRLGFIDTRLAAVEASLASQRGQLWKMFAVLVGLQVSAATLIVGVPHLP